MKKAILFVLLVLPAFGWTEKPEPAEYSLTVHVSSSGMVLLQGWNQVLEATIDGKKYKLEAMGHYGMIRVGDYKARIAEEDTKRSWEYTRKYEFMFPDGTVRSFIVVGESE